MAAENGSLDNVAMAMLHGNQWMCDCHVRYVVSWLLSNKFSTNRKPMCKAPRYLMNKSLVDFNSESLDCKNRHWLINYVTIKNTSSSSISLSWIPRKKSPDFISPMIVVSKTTEEEADKRLGAESMMTNHRTVADLIEDEEIKLNNLTSNTTYVLCVYESDQQLDEILASQCFTVTTQEIEVADALNEQTDNVNLILVIVVSFLLTSSIAAIFYYIKRRYELKRENPHAETDSIQYYEASTEKKREAETKHQRRERTDEQNYLMPMKFTEEGRKNNRKSRNFDENYLTPIGHRDAGCDCYTAASLKKSHHSTSSYGETAYMVISATPQVHMTAFSNYDVIQPAMTNNVALSGKNIQNSSGGKRFVARIFLIHFLIHLTT